MSLDVNSRVISQIMDLKTSVPGVTRKEEIKTGFDSIAEYTKHLQEKYSYMNSGKTSMQGVPVTVSVSEAFLRKCKDNPEKAAFLEENLSAIPECMKRSVAFTSMMPGSPVMTFASISFDDNGNITMMSGCTNDPDGKIAEENAKRRVAEERAEKKKSEERRKDKKVEQEQIEKQRAEMISADSNGLVFSVIGTDMKEITDQLLDKWGAGEISGTIGLDLKA